MAMLIPVDGEITDVYPENQTDFSLKELYKLIGCETVGRVILNDEFEMWFDEEGKIIGRPFNENATEIFKFWHPGLFGTIVGTALVSQRGEVL